MYRIIKISLLLLLIISVQGLFGQTSPDKIPNGIAIQSVARDASGNAASNRNIFLKVELRQGTSTGESVLVETHSVTSNDEGIFNFYIGQGARVSGATSIILLDWKGKIYFLNIKMAIEPSLPTPGWVLEREYVDLGTSQIWSVPYAFSAYRAVVADSATAITGILPGSQGGTGVSNVGKTITLGRNFELQGSGNLKFNTTGPTSLILPTNGTLVTSESIDTLVNKFLLSPTFLGTPKTPTADSASNDGSVASTQFVKSAISSEINTLNTKLSNTIDTSAGSKLKIADTSVMLSQRIDRDTASLSNRINLKVNTLNARIDSNLYVKGRVKIDSVLTINDSLRVKGNVLIDTNLNVGKVTSLNDSLYVKGKARFDSLLTINDSLRVKGNVLIDTNLKVGNDLEVIGNLILNRGLVFNDSLVVQKGARIEQSILANSKLYVSDSVLAKGNVKIDNNLNVGKVTSLNDSLYVKGRARFDSLLTINDSLRVKGNVLIDTNLTVGKDLEVKGNLILNSGLQFNDSLIVSKGARIEQSILAKSKLYVSDSVLAKGNVKIDNNLNVGKVTSLNDSLYVKGQARFDSLLTINDSLRVKGNVLIDTNLTVGKDLEVKGNLILNSGLQFNDSLIVTKGARIEQSILAKSKLYVSDSILAKGSVKIDNDLYVNGLKINDSIMKYDTSKVDVVDTAAMLTNYARKFTKNVKLNLASGRTLGKYNVGDSVYVKGKTLDEFLYDISTVQIVPTYYGPSSSVGISGTTSYEIGTRMDLLPAISLTHSFTQNDAGAEASPSTAIYYKGGVSMGEDVTTDIAAGNVSGSTRILTTPINYTVQRISYAAGNIKNDNLGNPYPTGKIIAGTIDGGNTASITTFQYSYYGPSTTSVVSDYFKTTIKSAAKSQTLSFSSLVNEYIFYAYPSALGDLSSIKIGGFESLDAFNKTTVNLVNASGYSMPYIVYTSNNFFNIPVNGIIFQ